MNSDLNSINNVFFKSFKVLKLLNRNGDKIIDLLLTQEFWTENSNDYTYYCTGHDFF